MTTQTLTTTREVAVTAVTYVTRTNTTYCLDSDLDIYITRQPNGDWTNSDMDGVIERGSYLADFYERFAARYDENLLEEGAVDFEPLGGW